MNLIEIAGYLAGPPETRHTSGGQKVVSMRLASKNRKGETTWYRLTIWGDRFDKLLPHLGKGSALIVVGELQTPTIYNFNGQQVVSLEIYVEIIRFSPFGKAEKKDDQSPSLFGPVSDQKPKEEPFVEDEDLPF